MNTPRGAIENGASDIVVGRPILTAENPGEVIREMIEQMEIVSVIATKEAIQSSESRFLHSPRGHSLRLSSNSPSSQE